MTKAAADGKTQEAPVVARLRERIARIFSYVEDVMYVGLAALLALSALVLLGTTALTLGHGVAGGVLPASIIGLLDVCESFRARSRRARWPASARPG